MRLRITGSLLAVSLLAAGPAWTQTTPSPPVPQATPQEIPQPNPGQPGAPTAPATNEQVTDPTKKELTTDPAVRQSQDPQVTPQGTRAPQLTERPTATVAEAYGRFVVAPPSVDGAPQARPNPLASNPPSLERR